MKREVDPDIVELKKKNNALTRELNNLKRLFNQQNKTIRHLQDRVRTNENRILNTERIVGQLQTAVDRISGFFR